jgi:hypothetical protein
MKTVEVKTPLELQKYIWIDGALLSLQDLLELLALHREAKQEQTLDLHPVPWTPTR